MPRCILACCVAVLICLSVLPGHAAGDTWFDPANLPPQLQHPLKLLATTAMSGEGRDFFSLKPGQTATIGTVTGPAIIFRVWSTSSNTKLSSLEMIVDGKKETLVAKGALPAGVAQNDPLRGLDMQAYCSYHPVLVKKQAVFRATSFEKNVTEPMKFYLQVGYRQVPAGELAAAQAVTVTRLRDLAADLARDPFKGLPTLSGEDGLVTPQKPAVLPFGPAVIRGMVVEVEAGTTPQQLQATRLTVTCDGVNTIDAPLGALFGVGSKLSDYTSAVVAVQGTRLMLRLPMYVGKELRVAIGDFGGKGLGQIRLQALPQTVKAAPEYRLCAQHFSQVSVTDQPLTLLNVTGRGIFLGTNLSVDGKDRKTFAFLEGNEQIYVDGSTKPAVEGTGTEDYFNGAWYFEAGERKQLFHGVTFKQDREPPRVDCYRYLISDCLPFQQSLRVDLQHGSRNKAPDVLYSGVMFWYQVAPTGVAEPVAAPAPAVQHPAADTSPGPAGGFAGPAMVAGFVAALAIVGLLGWWFLRKRA